MAAILSCSDWEAQITANIRKYIDASARRFGDGTRAKITANPLYNTPEKIDLEIDNQMRVAQLTLDAIERQATDEVNGNSSKIDEDFIAEKAKIPSKDDCKKSWGRVQSAISADLDGYDKKITKAYEDRLSSTPESYVRWARIRSRQVIAQRVGGIV